MDKKDVIFNQSENNEKSENLKKNCDAKIPQYNVSFKWKW